MPCPRCDALTPLPYLCRECWTNLSLETKREFYRRATDGRKTPSAVRWLMSKVVIPRVVSTRRVGPTYVVELGEDGIERAYTYDSL